MLGCLRELTSTATVRRSKTARARVHDVQVAQRDGVERTRVDGVRSCASLRYHVKAVSLNRRSTAPARDSRSRLGRPAPGVLGHDHRARSQPATRGSARRSRRARAGAPSRRRAGRAPRAGRARRRPLRVALQEPKHVAARTPGLPPDRSGAGSPRSPWRRRRHAPRTPPSGAPRLSASMPAAPLPANRSRNGPPSGSSGSASRRRTGTA